MCKTRMWLAVAATTVLTLAVAISTHAGVVWRQCCLYSNPYAPCSGCWKTTDGSDVCILLPTTSAYTCETLGSYDEECMETSYVCHNLVETNYWYPDENGDCLGQCSGTAVGTTNATKTIYNSCMFPTDYCP